MAIQIELPFAVKKEEESESTVITNAVKNKSLLQKYIKSNQQNKHVDSFEKKILFLFFTFKLTLVCDSKENKPDDHRVYLRRISAQFDAEGFTNEIKITKFDNSIIEPWIDALSLRNNWAGRELLGEIYRQVCGLLYVNSIWDELKYILEQERSLSNDFTPIIVFNHPIMATEVTPSNTESGDGLIKEGKNTFKFLKRKARELGVILIGEYRNFFHIDRFIQDIEREGLCNGYSFKKHFDTDYLLLNNALSPFQETSSKGWPDIIYPPNFVNSIGPSNTNETYFYAKYYKDDPFICFEVVGDIDSNTLKSIASPLIKIMSARNSKE